MPIQQGANFTLKSDSRILAVTVYDINGKRITELKGSHNNCKVRELPCGIYLLKINLGLTEVLNKVVIQ